MFINAPDLLVRPIIEERERDVIAIATAAAVRRASAPPPGLRAGLASRLTRLALSLHREAAAEVALRPQPER